MRAVGMVGATTGSRATALVFAKLIQSAGSGTARRAPFASLATTALLVNRLVYALALGFATTVSLEQGNATATRAGAVGHVSRAIRR
jgi:hypothetical protein